MNVQISQIEADCLLQMLVREIHEHSLIFYKEFFELVQTFLHKQSVMDESLRCGIEYRAITKECYKYLLAMKQAKIDLAAVPS